MQMCTRYSPMFVIQSSTGNSDSQIIQRDRSSYKAPNLTSILENNNIKKMFHYGRADVAHIKYYLKANTNNIQDTKIASKLARSYSDNHSLKTVIKKRKNIDISKQVQNSDLEGERNSAQLQYCDNDVSERHKIHRK